MYHAGGDGSANVETSGTVYDRNSVKIGNLLDIVMHAVEAWNHLLVRYELARGRGVD